MKKLLFLVLIALAIWGVVTLGKKSESENQNQNIDVSKFLNYENEDVKIERIEIKDNSIVGTIKNKENNEQKLVSIKFTSYDKDGNKTGDFLNDSIEKLEAGGTWDFEIKIHNKDIAKVDNIEITSY